LKPANVLWHDERWKIADFGIARFVEDSTSLQTLRGFLSPPFAAPEQWRLERASAATDIYALGCLAYSLLTGEPPLCGPDYREQHLGSPPPDLTTSHPRLRSVILAMMRKTPEARTTRERALRQLRQFPEDANGVNRAANLALAEIGAVEATRLASSESKEERFRAEILRREGLAHEAMSSLCTVSEGLLARIEREVPTARIDSSGSRGTDSWRAELGGSEIEIKLLPLHRLYLYGQFRASGWDVIRGGRVSVAHQGPQPYLWEASLWYTNAGIENYRWWEVAFMDSPLLIQQKTYQPYALDDVLEADRAMAPAMGVAQQAYEPRPIDDEDMEDFVARWIKLIVRAYRGELAHPRILPLDWNNF
jgi:serine/threonine-protein kinase